MKNNSIDFIYQRYSLLNATGVLLSLIKKVPLILEYNGSEVWVDTFWATKKRMTLKWPIRLIEWVNIYYAHKIIVVSQALKNELMQRGVDQTKILVNPNGVNTSTFNSALLEKERCLIRNQLALTNTFVFGFIGTFNKWHGIELLVEIIPAIVLEKPQARFLLIGDGPLYTYAYETLQEYVVKKKVIFTGIIAQHEAKNYLAACDAFLSPTQPNPDGTPFFGSPTKIFEYLSMGKPVIASDLEQISEVISPAIRINNNGIYYNDTITDQIGFIVEPQNIQQFIQASCALIDLDNDTYDRLGFNARKKAVQQYDWYNHVNKIIIRRKNSKIKT